MTKILRRFQQILPTLSTVEFSVDPYHLFWGWWFYGYLHAKLGNLACSRLVHKQWKTWACARERAQDRQYTVYRHALNREILPFTFSSYRVQKSCSYWVPGKVRLKLGILITYSSFSLTWRAAMQVYWNVRICFHAKKEIFFLPQDQSSKPTGHKFAVLGYQLCFSAVTWEYCTLK